MAKKKTAKTDRTNKAPLEPITAEPKVQAAGEDSVNPLAEKIEAEPPKAAEEQIEKLPQTEPANAATAGRHRNYGREYPGGGTCRNTCSGGCRGGRAHRSVHTGTG